MAVYRKYFYFVFVAFMTIFWSVYAILRMIIDFLANPSTYFKVKNRPVMPEVLTKEWNHAFIQLSEVKLHYVVDGPRDKPLMLMLHGYPEFWYSWRHLIRAFKNDYMVVAVDMRGYGQSDKPSGIDNYTIKKLTNDVKELVSALGHQSCVLVAHDWGGLVAWYTVLQYPELVSKLVIFNCPHPKIFASVIRTSWKQTLKTWYLFFSLLPYLPEKFCQVNDFHLLDKHIKDPASGGCINPAAFTEEDLEAWKYTFSQPGAMTPVINYDRAAIRLIGIPRISNWQAKPRTLIVWGMKDQFWENMAESSIKLCPQDSVVRFIENASHWVQQDAPELCIKYMKDFL